VVLSVRDGGGGGGYDPKIGARCGVARGMVESASGERVGECVRPVSTAANGRRGVNGHPFRA
jgi:hypothetical protein